jgi:hypothetical protein
MKVAMMVGDTVAVEAGDTLVEVEVEVEVEDAIIVERKGILRETVLMLVTSERICRWFQSMITRLWCFSVILLWVVAFPRFSDCFFIPPPPYFLRMQISIEDGTELLPVLFIGCFYIYIFTW